MKIGAKRQIQILENLFKTEKIYLDASKFTEIKIISNDGKRHLSKYIKDNEKIENTDLMILINFLNKNLNF